MIELVFPNIYRLEIELPNNPLKSLNSYLIKGKDRNLIIDTGMNRKECLGALEYSLRELKVNLQETDLFITHMHADHSGLVSYFQSEGTKIFCSRADAAVINEMSKGHYWEKMRTYAKSNGFPENELTEAIDNHPGHRYCNKQTIHFDILEENNTILIGDYQFSCIETPGHTKGHLCLYEPNHKLLIAGDHVLQDITPNIMLWSDEGNPLEEYLESLNKILDLKVELVLPGHRKVFREYKQRIVELIEHHRVRAAEALAILNRGPQSIFQIAAQMTWDVKYLSWSQFPPQQKLFASSEILAHLQYLLAEGQVRKEPRGKGFVWVRKDPCHGN